jgi:hypothetical protein
MKIDFESIKPGQRWKITTVASYNIYLVEILNIVKLQYSNKITIRVLQVFTINGTVTCGSEEILSFSNSEWDYQLMPGQDSPV